MTPEQAQDPAIHPMAPLIRLTLLGLYLALVLPLPPLAPEGLRLAMAVLVALGLLLVLAVTSERVELDAQGLRVGHPAWCRWLLRRGWSLQWSQVRGLTPVATSQGGRVYYVRNTKGAATLLPQRVAAFEDFLGRFSQQTGLDTSSIGRISPPWTYQLLAVLVVALLIGEIMALAVRPIA
ncbi:hypothetical protein VB716_11585 [Synechococcus sp. CCY9201]|uniref:hypothetical protein n=1 Tax=unclassified Synechococcus TaxID=2626047 RepID=UPI002B1F23EE|nr:MULTISPECIES: hypothetical protein [unclassified Synechococcus]MEA5424009.1 hypothetical protein [Synechococcus sp. CCY9202]MEA5474861.1 hypothetical protein [Synechococcus sp. CCY9201]